MGQEGSVFAGVLKRSHVEVPDGKEKRQSLWEETLGSYDISIGKRTSYDIDAGQFFRVTNQG